MNNSHRGSLSTYGNPESRLWKPINLGNQQLSHRLVLAPLTRCRAIDGIPNELHVEYYRQRASPGGLLITEATFISSRAGGYSFAPGIYSKDQIESWKKVTDAVHAKGGIIYCQLWALGRANSSKDIPVVSASDIPLKKGQTPRPLTIEEIHQYVKDYQQAALNAVDAGFDGVEIHGAHGYLLDQFIDIACNNRTDVYGGPIENRARFLLETMEAVASVVGPEKMAVRISPFSVFQEMTRDSMFQNFGFICKEIARRFSSLAYISVTDPRLDTEVGGVPEMNKYTSDYFRAIFRGVDPDSVGSATIFEEPNIHHPTLFLAAGGYAAADAEPCSDRTGDLIGFGRFFIANPDLPHRLKAGLELNPYDRSTFYTQDHVGYTDYPFATEITQNFIPPTKEMQLLQRVEQLGQENSELKLRCKEIQDKLPDVSILKETVNSHRGSEEYGLNPDSRVWKPVKCGRYQLLHRIAMAPLTRMRAIEGVPQDIVVDYYKQRATTGGLLVSEATFIAREAGGYPNAPIIETKEQVEGWKKVTAAVHEKGGIIYCQLWAIGRANYGDMPDVKVVSSGTIPSKGGIIPEQMTVEDIQRYLKHYKNAALNAIEAGFDGVEVHGAHGYLLEQFLRPDINATRSDEYSGSLENRGRFMLEAVQTVVDAVGEDRSAIRISPFTGEEDIDPYENWGYVVEQLRQRFPKLSYLSMTDPRLDPEGTKKFSSDYFRAILRGHKGPISKLSDDEHKVHFEDPNEEYPTLFLSAGGYTASDAEPCGDRTGDLIGYGRIYISNPDLVHRLKNGLAMNAYDRSSFYSRNEIGLTDYPFVDKDTLKFVPLAKRPINEVLKELQDSHDNYMNEMVKAKVDARKLREKAEDEAKTLENAQAKFEKAIHTSEATDLEKSAMETELKKVQHDLEQLKIEYNLLKESATEKEPKPKNPMETTVIDQDQPEQKEEKQPGGCICQ
jgi:2,4-dienoyl-CoA reductase-like NADH-dependent reductase (Old Yellow Enzyme family)